jgi:hypothetical protein
VTFTDQFTGQPTGQQPESMPDSMPEPAARPRRWNPSSDIVRGLLPIIFAGALIVAVSLLALRFPTATPDDPGASSAAHLMRVVSRFEGAAPLMPGVILDIGVYVAVIATFVLMFAAGTRGNRGALTGLIGVGLLGIAYVSSMVLFVGPMVSLCGFSLILFGSLTAWAVSGTVNESDQ